MHLRAYRTMVAIFKLLSHGKPSETAMYSNFAHFLYTPYNDTVSIGVVSYGNYPSLHVGKGSIALVVIVPRWWWVSVCGNVAEVGSSRRDGLACSLRMTKDALDEGWSVTWLRLESETTHPPKHLASSMALSLAMTACSIFQ